MRFLLSFFRELGLWVGLWERIDVRHGTRSMLDKFEGADRLFTHTLSLKMANRKVGSLLTESNIHSDKVFLGRRVKTFIIALMKGIPNKHICLSLRGKFGLIRVKIMDLSGTTKHTKGNLRN